jgi:hypothetical protein
VLCIPAWEEADELAALMLAKLLEQHGIDAKVIPVATLATNAGVESKWGASELGCVCGVTPFAYVHVRYRCRRLQAYSPGLRLAAALLTVHDAGELKRRQLGIPVPELAGSLKQALAIMLRLLEVPARDSVGTGRRRLKGSIAGVSAKSKRLRLFAR